MQGLVCARRPGRIEIERGDMVVIRFNDVITSEEQLRDVFGWPTERAKNKQIGHIDKHCRSIIAKSPFILLGTSNTDGRCDVSPKGDFPGFVRVLDDRTLAIPDLPGNNRLDTLTNMLANPRVGLIFMIPGMNETLRVNGRSTLVRDEELLASLAFEGKRPKLAIIIDVEEVFTHCPKAFLRSKLWGDENRIERTEIASFAEILRDHAGLGECDIEAMQQEMNARNQATLH
jgi:hypothetical protein